MNEKTLVLLKPDSVQRGLVGEIISRFEKCCLKIVAMKMVYANKEMAGEHYANDKDWLMSVGNKAIESAKAKGEEIKITDPLELGQRVRSLLMDYLCMSPVIALVIEGHNAVAKVRKIVGGTNPQSADMGTIRGDYAIDSYKLADDSNRPVQNLIHASGEIHEAEREIKLWFKEDEVHSWSRVDEHLIYRKN